MAKEKSKLKMTKKEENKLNLWFFIPGALIFCLMLITTGCMMFLNVSEKQIFFYMGLVHISAIPCFILLFLSTVVEKNVFKKRK